MTKGVKAYEKRTNKAFIHLLRAKNLKIIDLRQILRCGENRCYDVAENYRILTVDELLTLSATFDTSFLELVAMLHLNKSKLNTEDKQSLQSLIEKVEKEQGK